MSLARTVPNASRCRGQAMIQPDRIELLVAASCGAVLGFVTGYVAGKPLFGKLIWALIGAVVASAAAYCLRAFRW